MRYKMTIFKGADIRWILTISPPKSKSGGEDIFFQFKEYGNTKMCFYEPKVYLEGQGTKDRLGIRFAFPSNMIYVVAQYLDEVASHLHDKNLYTKDAQKDLYIDHRMAQNISIALETYSDGQVVFMPAVVPLRNNRTTIGISITINGQLVGFMTAMEVESFVAHLNRFDLIGFVLTTVSTGYMDEYMEKTRFQIKKERQPPPQDRFHPVGPLIPELRQNLIVKDEELFPVDDSEGE